MGLLERHSNERKLDVDYVPSIDRTHTRRKPGPWVCLSRVRRRNRFLVCLCLLLLLSFVILLRVAVTIDPPPPQRRAPMTLESAKKLLDAAEGNAHKAVSIMGSLARAHRRARMAKEHDERTSRLLANRTRLWETRASTALEKAHAFLKQVLDAREASEWEDPIQDQVIRIQELLESDVSIEPLESDEGDSKGTGRSGWTREAAEIRLTKAVKSTGKRCLPPNVTCLEVPGCESKGCHTFLVLPCDGSGEMKKDAGGDTLWVLSMTQMLLGPNATNVVHILSPRALPPCAAPAPSLAMFEGLPNVFLLDPQKTRYPTCALAGMKLKNRVDVWQEGTIRAGPLRKLAQHLDARYHYSAVILRERPGHSYGIHLVRSKLAPKSVVFGLKRENDLPHGDIFRHGGYEGVLSPMQFQGGAYSVERDGIERHTVWLPPIVSEVISTPRDTPRGQTVCYIGTYPHHRMDYMIADMRKGFVEARKTLPGLTFLAIFTSFHRATADEERALAETEGLYILPPVSHNRALVMYRDQCDLGVRGLRGDTRNILSTKVLEMGAMGLPVILNPQEIHIALLGEDYPLYWTFERPIASFSEALIKGLTNHTVFQRASQQLHDVAQTFKASHVYDMFMDAMQIPRNRTT